MPEDEQRFVQRLSAVMGAGYAAGLAQLQSYKDEMDQELRSGRFEKWCSCKIWFTGDLSVASTGAPTPNYDFSDNVLQVLHNEIDLIESLYYSVLPVESDGGVVVFVWRREYSAPQRYVHSLIEDSEVDLASLVIQVLFAYVENTYFSPDWWTSLSPRDQRHIRDLAQNGNPYYRRPEFLNDSRVPWKIENVEWRE